MLSPFNPNKTRTVICPFDTSEPQATFEICETLSYGQRCELKDMMLGGDATEEAAKKNLFQKLGERNKTIIRYGVKSWNNVECGTTMDELIDALALIPTEMKEYETALDWLADEIWKRSHVSDEDKKK